MIIDMTQYVKLRTTRNPFDIWFQMSMMGLDYWRMTAMTAEEFVKMMDDPLKKTFVFAWVAKEMQSEYSPTGPVHVWLEAVYQTCAAIIHEVHNHTSGGKMGEVIPFPIRDK